MQLITAGNKSPLAYFKRSGIREKKNLPHNPFIVFRQSADRTVVEIVDNPEELVKLPRRTKVMSQWKGKKKSDFVRFTVGQLRDYIAANPKQDCMVI